MRQLLASWLLLTANSRRFSSCQAFQNKAAFSASSSIAMMAYHSSSAVAALPKELIIVRHGQAEHNPRAEVAKAGGCSMEEFIALMREDDVWDAALTPKGRLQAQAARLPPQLATSIQLVVSSSLSRALETANHILHPMSSSPAAPEVVVQHHHHHHARICHEHFREVNGDMLNVKRRNKSELIRFFPGWDFGELDHEEDALWTPIMEDLGAAAERGYLGFKWLMERPEDNILLVSHGGILRYTMTDHPHVVLRDERSQQNGVKKPVDSRFDNCEMRRYRLSWEEDEKGEGDRRAIVLTQIDDFALDPKEL